MSESNRTRKTLFVAVCVIVFVATAGFAFWASLPVGTSSSVARVRGANTSDGSKPLASSYFTTQIPDFLVVKSQNNVPHGNTLLQTFLTANTHSLTNPLTDQLGISIGKLPSDGLSGLTDVRFRSSRAETYKPIGIDDFPSGSQTFIKTENDYEMSTFWQHGDYYAAVVVSGTNDRSDELAETLHTTVQSWQWRQ